MIEPIGAFFLGELKELKFAHIAIGMLIAEHPEVEKRRKPALEVGEPKFWFTKKTTKGERRPQIESRDERAAERCFREAAGQGSLKSQKLQSLIARKLTLRGIPYSVTSTVGLSLFFGFRRGELWREALGEGICGTENLVKERERGFYLEVIGKRFGRNGRASGIGAHDRLDLQEVP